MFGVILNRIAYTFSEDVGLALLNGNKMKKFLSPAAMAAIAILTVSAAHAVEPAGTMTVSITLSRNCTVAVNPQAFGTVIRAGAVAEGVVSITCTGDNTADAPTISYNKGNDLSSTSSLWPRRDSASTASLFPYAPTSSQGGTNVARTDPVAATATGGGISCSAAVCGSIAAGTYEIRTFVNTITVTVTDVQ